LDSLSAWTGSWNAWTSSINEIRDNGVLQGYSTRLYFEGLVSASIVPNVNGAIATINIEQDGTKLNTASFDAFSSSVSASIIQLSSDISEVSESLYLFSQSIDLIDNTYATTGSNTFNGNQTVNGFVSASNGFYSGPNTTALTIGDGSNVRFISGSSYYNVQLVPGVGDIAFSRNGDSNIKVFTLAGGEGNNTTFQNNPVVFNNSVSSLTINAQSTAISGSGSYSLNASTITNTATNVTTNASASFRGTLDITGQSGGDGRAILLGHSGSLVIGNSGTNSTYSDLSFISSSAANANTNLIFKSNTNTASLTISGSANVIIPSSAPTAEFKRYLGGSGNLVLSATAMPQITGSNQISPTFSNNTFQGSGFFMRTPVSSSAWTISGNTFNNFGSISFGTAQATSFVSASAGVSMVNNFIGGTLNQTAHKTQLYSPVAVIQSYFGGTLTINNDSSSVQFVNSAMNGALTIHNSYNAGTTTQTNSLSVNAGNVFMGTNNTIYASGSNTTTSQQRQFQSNALLGSAHSASVVLNGDNAQLTSTALIGHALVVTGSSAITTTQATAADRGTAIVGRFNAPVNSGNTVFAVGSGTSTSARRNAILVDSGSNTFVEGSLTITGSVYGNVSASTITSSTASIDLSAANYFTLTLSGTTRINVTNPRPGVTATLVINTDTAASASFSSNVKQPSGSLYAASPSGNVDIISFTAVDSNTVYAFPAQSFV
jgi:hypothetical protein